MGRFYLARSEAKAFVVARSASSRSDSLMPLARPRPYLRGPAGSGTTLMLLPSSIHASRDCSISACLLRISTGITVWPLDEMVLVDVVPTIEM
jgi:hypothetical protein